MKKLLVVAILALGATSFAQEKMEKRNADITPQERKEIQEKRIDLQATKLKAELDLTDDQVAKLKDMYARQHQGRLDMQQKMMEIRKTGQKPTEEQRLNMKNDRDAFKEKFDNEFKSILTADQFAKWEKNTKERQDRMRKNGPDLEGMPFERKK